MLKQSGSFKSGFIAGILGTIGDFTIHTLSYFLIGTSMTAHYISQLIFPNKEVTMIRFLFGLFTHFWAGALVGVVLYGIYIISGKENAYLKGISFGIGLWILHVIVIPNMVEPRPFVFRTEIEAFVDLLAHIIYGLVAAFYLLRVPISNPNN